MATTEKKPETATKVRYAVLRLDAGGWNMDGPFQTAGNAGQAIRQAVALRAESDVDPSGEYVAVPVRSWNPVKVSVQTKLSYRLD